MKCAAIPSLDSNRHEALIRKLGSWWEELVEGTRFTLVVLRFG